MILVYLLVFTSIGLLSYYLIFSCLSIPKKEEKEKLHIDAFSLIICAKNERKNLEKNLPKFLEQEGLTFEVIVVDHASSDTSLEYLQFLAKDYPALKILSIKEEETKNNSLKGKRLPLMRGIEQAQYDYVVLSDADCWPESKYFLKAYQKAFYQNTEIVLGYSPYERKKGLLSDLIQYESFLTAIQYLSLARIGFPYMGVGRNIAYKKAIFSRELFEKSNKSQGGDDDLLISQIANASNTEILLEANSFVLSSPSSSFFQWFIQKKRHYSTAKHYTWDRIVIVGAFGFFNLLFYFILFAMLLKDFAIIVSFSLYLFKQGLFVLFNWKNFKLLKIKHVIKLLFYLDLFYFVFFLLNHCLALLGKNGWRKR